MRDQSGQALLETLPLIVIFTIFIATGLGLFGAIHTGVLHSIAARTYSFETFRNRTNLYYFREDGSGLEASKSLNYTKKGWRYHAVQNEIDQRNRFVSTVRPVTFGWALAGSDASIEQHNNGLIFNLPQRNGDGGSGSPIAVNPIWVMVGYGICLNSGCGD